MTAPPDGGIVVRPATTADLPFVRALDVEAAVAGIPATRAITPAELRRAALASYERPETRRLLEEGFETLVAQDWHDDAPRLLGFIRLDFASREPATGEPQCFIDQLAVTRDQWGRGATHRLVARAAELAAERGLGYLVGMVSASNRRTLEIAVGALGFEVERVQIVLRCGPGAPAVPSVPPIRLPPK